ncbi:MAG: SGNH/GDSL hydrolase family protein [Anaerolineae bacterium]|nr:SGNH/GDSL hydrolase family protein [Gloeobacterales cyanobacterium ES-bin-313]
MSTTFRSSRVRLWLGTCAAAFLMAAPMATQAQTDSPVIDGKVLSSSVSSQSNAPIPPESVEDVYVFGDSLVDTGNVFNANGGLFPPSPPYFSGRFSNGPLWIENVLSPLGISLVPSTTGGQNFAFGGAPSGFFLKQPIAPGGPPPETPGLLYQLGTFSQPRPTVTPQTLYFITAGANDFLNDFLSGRELDFTVPVQNLSTAVSTLYAYGARNIVISNVPDLSRFPLTQANPEALPSLSKEVKQFNDKLKAALDELQKTRPDLNIILLDFQASFNQFLNHPDQFGFTNTTTPCVTPTSVCANPEEYLFWDEAHPTAAAGQALAEMVAPQIFQMSPP